ncbi:efflux RND transporter periplasmic adaptor subunit [Marinilabiliaceae bacterium JC017]|nr:efflux RND transporter periplasmic adaptor subunit [Marinilabiliaceae bacterium JC017]
MKNPIILCLTNVLLFVACNNQSSDFSTDVAVNVSVEEVEYNPIEQTLMATGTIKPVMAVIIKNEMAGNYYLQKNPRTRSPFKMGDEVQKGDRIIRLEDKEYENRANIEGARLDLEISEMEYKKQQALYEKGGVTLRELVNSEKTLVSARQSHENAQISLDKMQIVAPFSGVITNLPYYSQGVRLETGQEVLSLMNYSTMLMDLQMPENLMGEVKMNQLVNIMNYTLPDDTLRGKISELSPAIDEATRSFKGRVIIENESMMLRPGMFVKAEVVVAAKDSALVIPKDVVLVEGNRKVVFVAANETAEKRFIKTGIENNGQLEVLDGLKKDERVIVKGFETLKDRSKINVVK